MQVWFYFKSDNLGRQGRTRLSQKTAIFVAVVKRMVMRRAELTPFWVIESEIMPIHI